MHGMSAGMNPTLLAIVVGADIVTAAAYLAIAVTLTLLVHRLREDLPFSALFLLFGAFIVLCGATHLMGVLTLKWPLQGVSAVVLVVTAAVSLLTAVVFPRSLPRIQALVRDAATAREREREHARAEALAEANVVLAQQATALEAANAQLTESLARRDQLESQLRQAQKMEVMGRLASGVAHDFNNLLMVIQGNVELARAELGDASPSAAMLDDVAKATEGATQLTRRLLSFGRQESGQVDAIELDHQLAADERLFRRALPGLMSLDFRYNSAPLSVAVSTTQLQQALLNLIVNARDAMGGNGTIVVETAGIEVIDGLQETTPRIPIGRYATVTVRDSGQGMSDEVRRRLFEPFFTTKPAGQGTGLGLAMVYDTATRHGGGVRVESQSGTGSAFTIFLPAAA